MELVEKIPLRPIHWLSQISFKDFVKKVITKDTTSKEMCETLYSIMQSFCKTNIKTGGITKRIYSYSLNTPAGLGGRLFSGGSIQSLPCTIRGLLMRNGLGTDIDMSNAHPVVALYICHLHGISCPHLEYYVNNRDECLI